MLLNLLVAAALAADAPPNDAVVLVVQGGATCAGAFIDDQGTVVTAYHCVCSGGRPRVETRDGRVAIGRVVGLAVRWDMALIEVPDLAGSAYLPVRRNAPAAGEPVRALGHPYGVSEPGGFLAGTLRWSVSQGIVSAVGPRAIQTTAPVALSKARRK